MMTKKIFLASSSELKEDREEFERLILRKNNYLVPRDVFLEVILWEDFLDAMSQTRLQDEYNKAIRGCDIFVMLFFTKVGQYTEEEFETAFGQFKATEKPLIYTYFKDAATSTGSLDREHLKSLWDFQDKLKRLGHFYAVYKNVDDLKFKFDQQLNKLAASDAFTEQIGDRVPEEKPLPRPQLPTQRVPEQRAEGVTVYISNTPENDAVAEALSDGLLVLFKNVRIFQKKYSTLLDSEFLARGNEHRDTISRQLDESDYLIQIVGDPASPLRTWQGFELGYYLAKTKVGQVIVIIDPALSGYVFEIGDAVQVVQATSTELNKLMRQLVDKIGSPNTLRFNNALAKAEETSASIAQEFVRRIATQSEQSTHAPQQVTKPPAAAMPAKAPPIIGIMLHDTVIEDYRPGLNYPRKLRLYLSNEGSDIILGKGKWITEGVGLQAGKPSTCKYQKKNELDKWTGESSFITIYSGQWFRLYIGLDSTVQEEKLKAMAKNHSLGILEIPARTGETDVVIKIRP